MFLILLISSISGCEFKPKPELIYYNNWYIKNLAYKTDEKIADVNERIDLKIRYKSKIAAFYYFHKLDFLAQRKLYIDNLNKQLTCLALNIYHEANFNSTRGMEAVALVTLNRLKYREYPDTVCKVVYQRDYDPITHKIVCQFSWTCWNQPKAFGPKWWKSLEIAREVYFGHLMINGFSNVTLYYADYIPPPRWAAHSIFVARIDNQLFYEPEN